jgi:aromatic ring-opening dioxygenase LigB subunit
LEWLRFAEDVAEERRPEARAGEHCCGGLCVVMVCIVGFGVLVPMHFLTKSRRDIDIIDDARLGRKQLLAADVNGHVIETMERRRRCF